MSEIGIFNTVKPNVEMKASKALSKKNKTESENLLHFNWPLTKSHVESCTHTYTAISYHTSNAYFHFVEYEQVQ